MCEQNKSYVLLFSTDWSFKSHSKLPDPQSRLAGPYTMSCIYSVGRGVAAKTEGMSFDVDFNRFPLDIQHFRATCGTSRPPCHYCYTSAAPSGHLPFSSPRSTCANITEKLTLA